MSCVEGMVGRALRLMVQLDYQRQFKSLPDTISGMRILPSLRILKISNFKHNLYLEAQLRLLGGRVLGHVSREKNLNQPNLELSSQKGEFSNSSAVGRHLESSLSYLPNCLKSSYLCTFLCRVQNFSSKKFYPAQSSLGSNLEHFIS